MSGDSPFGIPYLPALCEASQSKEGGVPVETSAGERDDRLLREMLCKRRAVDDRATEV